MANNIEDHIDIFDVKPTRSTPSAFTAVSEALRAVSEALRAVSESLRAVSEALRAGLKTYRDKVVIGVMNCKIYDRYHIKKCNHC